MEKFLKVYPLIFSTRGEGLEWDRWYMEGKRDPSDLTAQEGAVCASVKAYVLYENVNANLIRKLAINNLCTIFSSPWSGRCVTCMIESALSRSCGHSSRRVLAPPEDVPHRNPRYPERDRQEHLHILGVGPKQCQCAHNEQHCHPERQHPRPQDGNA